MICTFGNASDTCAFLKYFLSTFCVKRRVLQFFVYFSEICVFDLTAIYYVMNYFF